MKVALVRSKFTYFGGAEKFVERALEALVLVDAQPTLIGQSWKSTEDNPPFPTYFLSSTSDQGAPT
jgi:UDP-glucose:(heptosyl)LPS alpha-1,3-glucosyltransferase